MAVNETALKERIDQQALEQIFRNMPTLWLSAVLVGALFVAGLWNSADRFGLLMWFAAYALSLIYRFYLTTSYFRIDSRQMSPSYWGGMLTRMGLYQGLIWGVASILFLNTESVSNQVLILCVVMAVPLATIPVTGYWVSVFYAYIFSSSGMLAAYLLYLGDVVHVVLGVLLLIYLAVALSIGWTVSRELREGVRLRFENLDLVEELSQANQSKSRFLAAASHDLRQPVHSMALFAESLTPEVQSERGKELLEHIHETLGAHNTLLNSLLDISKLDAGVVEPHITALPLRPILEQLHREMLPKAQDKGLQLQLRGCDFHVRSDASLLSNILRNLLSNAIRYTDTGWVMLACRRRNDQVLLQVWDSGYGIPDEEQEAIFIEFRQLHNHERDRSKGLGLGLAICRRLAAILQHDLSVASRPGKGSVFSLRLPRAEEQVASKLVSAPPSRWDLTGRNLLVVDDELSVRQGMAALLERWGCNVLLADGLDSALQAFGQAQGVDAIISDYRLRDNTTGVDVIQAVQMLAGGTLPAMLITGDTDPRRLQEAKDSGYALLHKPVKPAQMRNVLGALLQG